MAGKDGFMELGRLILQSGLDVVYIKNLRIEEQVNEHGRMRVRFLSRETLSPEDILRYQGSQVCLTTMEGEIVFCGQCMEIGLIAANAYQEIELTAQTLSIQTDKEPRNNTFQGTQKTLQDVLSAGIGNTALMKLEEDMPIAEMLSQEQETDWAFARRVANQYRKQLFVNSKTSGCQIHVGEVPFQHKELGSILHRAVCRDVDKVRSIQGNIGSGVSVFEYEETILTVCDLTIGVGCAVNYSGRTQIVTKSLITCRQGVVENQITLANEEGLSPAASKVMGGMGRSSILTGTVLKVEGTNVLVDFHSPNDTPRWVPYANAVSNYFYCMPDEKDTVYVYYETGDSDKVVCLGSRHVNQSPDFAQYQDKMLTADNRMIKFEEKALNLVGNRMEWDGEGGDQAKIIFNDELGIEIRSTGNISLETTDGGNITIQAVVKKDFAGMDGVRQGFQQHYGEGARKYAEDGGKDLEDYNAFLTLASREWEAIKENVWGNLTSPLQLVDTLQELSGRMFGNGEEAETAEEIVPDPPFEEGVIDLFALGIVVLQVGNSFLIIADGIIQIKTDTYMQLGTDRSIVYEHLEDANYTWRDMFLDIAQCALDIVGALPIPGLSTAANLVNAGISLARGDYLGAAMSAATAAASLIPGANTAVAAGAATVKAVSKTAKVLNMVKGIVKIAKAIKTGADTLNMVLTTGMSIYDIGVAIHDKSFDWNDPECRQDVANILQGVSATAQAGIESRVAGEGADRHFMDADERKTAREQRAAARQQRRENRAQLVNNIKEGARNAVNNARAGLHNLVENCIRACDPVEMVTGSYMFDQCDFVINDITGIYIVERTYESLLYSEDSPMGRGWTLNLFSRALVYDDRVEILLPNNHTETFLKTAEGFRNRRGGSLRMALEAQSDGYLLRDAENALLRFYDMWGRQTAVEDQNGNRTQYQYLEDTLQRIQFASGQYLDFQWEEDKVTSIRDCLGRKVTYHYQGDLLTEVETLTGGLEKYAYDTEGRVVGVTDANGVNYIHNEYDAKGRVTRQVLSNGQEYVILYDDANRVNTCLSPAGNREVRYLYNKDRQITRVVYQDGTAEEKGYDIWENRVWEKDRNGNETHRTFDEYSHLLEERFPDGRVVSYEYDGEGNCIHMWDNAGLSIRYAYDRKGNLIQETEQIDPAHSRKVSFEYDQYGRITAFTGPGGGRETYEYRHRFWAYEAFVSALGNRFEYAYDRAGRRVSATDGEGTCRYAYNNYDILCMAVNPLGETTKHVYDKTFNLVKVVRPNHANMLAANEKGETYTYDAFHKLLSRTDETGAVSAVLRDVEGNVVKEINPNCYDSTTRDGAGIEYGYDRYDNLCRVLYPDGGVERRWHDPVGNLVKVCRPEQYDMQGDCGEGYSYAYDSMGRLVQATAPDGTVQKRYAYDLGGNIVKVINAEGMGTGETDEDRIGELYTYNCLGWLTEVRKPMILGEEGAKYALTQFKYDTAGNLVQEKRFLEYQTETSASGRIHTITYQYDAESKLTRVIDCTGAEVEYRYDRQGRRIREKRKISATVSQVLGWRYDSAGRMVEQSRTADREGCGSQSVSVRYEYDKNGNATRILLPSGGEIRREYDDADRLVAERHLDKKGGIDNTTRFSYDRMGSLCCITDNRGMKTRMEHDLLGRETRRTERDGGVTRRFYDRNGNLAKVILPMEYLRAGDRGAGTLYAYDAMDRPVAVTRADGILQEGSAYDGCGRLIRRWDGVGNRTATTNTTAMTLPGT